MDPLKLIDKYQKAIKMNHALATMLSSLKAEAEREQEQLDRWANEQEQKELKKREKSS